MPDFSRIHDLMQERQELREECHRIHEEFESEEDATSWRAYKEERGYAEMQDKVMDLTDQIHDLQAAKERERKFAEEENANGGGPRGGRPEPNEGGEEERELPPLYEGREYSDLTTTQRRALEAYRDYAPRFAGRLGEVGLTDYSRAFRRYLASGEESRDLVVQSDPEGGFTSPPNFVADLIRKVDDEVFIRQLATTRMLANGDSVGRPSLESDPADSDWTSEVGQVSEDTAMAFGERELTPHQLTKLVKISRKLIRASAINAESLVRNRMAYKNAVPQEKAFLTGDGSQKPLGVFTASADGISTSRDISADNTTTAVTFDGLKNAKWALKGAYHGGALWVAHRDFGKQVDKITDSNGQYIWQTSVVDDEPDRLLGFPVRFSEFAPNTFTTGEYVAILGDFNAYWIVDALDLTVQRLDELYAETNHVGFISRSETDGMPVLEEAFVRVQLG